MNLANRLSTRHCIIALAVAHLAFFQLFLFANTDFTIAESIHTLCNHARITNH